MPLLLDEFNDDWEPFFYGFKAVIILVSVLIVFGIYKAVKYFIKNSRSKHPSNNK